MSEDKPYEELRTGWKSLDRIMQGGLRRGEMLVLSGDSRQPPRPTSLVQALHARGFFKNKPVILHLEASKEHTTIKLHDNGAVTLEKTTIPNSWVNHLDSNVVEAQIPITYIPRDKS